MIRSEIIQWNKLLVPLIVLVLLLNQGCQDEQVVLTEGTGIVRDFSGSGNCGMVIQLDDGIFIQPTFYPEGFIFAEGQRIEVKYLILKDVIPGCNKGLPCEILTIRQIGCATYLDLPFMKYDSLKNDPVDLHDAYIDGDCLHIKLSYSGGCREHTVDLARILPECGTPPLPPPTFEIRHNSNGDACEAYITKDLRFDLSPLKKEGTTQIILKAKLQGGLFSKTFSYPGR